MSSPPLSPASSTSPERAPDAALPRTLAAQLASFADREGDRVRISGWVHRRRRLKGLAFVIVRDRSGTTQVVVRDPATLLAIEALTEETTVDVIGTVSRNPQAPGGVEVVDPEITALTDPAATPPFELWRPTLSAGLPTLLDHGQVAWRHPRQLATWQLAAASLHGFRSTLDRVGFTEIQTPKLVESATESGSNVFEVDYFGRPAYLAQSPQFYKQMCVGIFERVYEVGPVFRAEPHDTVRHLAEYVSLDVELGFIRDHRDVLAVLRDVLAGMVTSIHELAPGAVELLGIDVPVVPNTIPVIHFKDALELVGAPSDEPDLAPAHERALGEWAREKHHSDFLAVEGYPLAKRAFYTHPQPDDTRWSNSFDLLFRGLELVTGGQRLHRYNDYVAALAARGEPQQPYLGYLDTFKHGMPPHGGFAIGLERWTARVVEAENIRQATLFPRDLHRLSP
ncbi:MAG TPA: aspartate--tRNA(Asn) ligase [Nocardioidaceae bacterium]|nr:aspartate--tRNA(Asn) ligase [Nocardioidaceae bacterium]